MTSSDAWSESRIPDLTGKTAIVTGANSGIGYETARALAGKGARVVLACRSAEKGEAAAARARERHPGADARFERLDLAELASVRAFADKACAELPALHILCNNGGVMMCPRGDTADGFETQFGTNHLGHFALTGLLLGALRSTPGARVVSVSSTYHRSVRRIDFRNLNAEVRYGRSRAYGQSKLANLLFTSELQRRFEAAGIDALAVAAHPGWTATDLQRHSAGIRWLNPYFSQSPPQGALPSLYAASAEDVKGDEYFGPSGPFELRGAPRRVGRSGGARDAEAARRLWERSEELTGVSYGI